ncbi:hypothetical protein QYE76_009874 [Lolium multiflorum]|uniref:Uncharacterized protein n=1 Tax=Lolium multiflorum TaxID=4521 RepID=A0AAD8TW39_LOLMU|nr:hypothetical protein QYE76_009874 [Lolium multiflorum]
MTNDEGNIQFSAPLSSPHFVTFGNACSVFFGIVCCHAHTTAAGLPPHRHTGASPARATQHARTLGCFSTRGSGIACRCPAAAPTACPGHFDCRGRA